MTSASCEMDSGAALRARAISAFRSIRYWSSGAILGYGVLASCAWACHTKPSKTTSPKLLNATILTAFCCIDSSGESGLFWGFVGMARDPFGPFGDIHGFHNRILGGEVRPS